MIIKHWNKLTDSISIDRFIPKNFFIYSLQQLSKFFLKISFKEQFTDPNKNEGNKKFNKYVMVFYILRLIYEDFFDTRRKSDIVFGNVVKKLAGPLAQVTCR